MRPLVSVVCVCYNHERFVIEALESVKAQTYAPIELIIVDDGSLDKSTAAIDAWVSQNQTVQFLDLKKNHGYCTAFNKGFAHAKGEFIIDLAADDVLLPNRIEEGVNGFLRAGDQYGVQFSDALYINAENNQMRTHSSQFPHQAVPQGNIYAALIQRYFICSPTTMIRKSVLEAMGGYDEQLHYEDFDLWIRASRDHLFFYIPEVLVKKRVVTNSLGQNQYTRNSKQMESTLKVCNKILSLNRTPEERTALNRRIGYELKWCLRFLRVGLIISYLSLLIRNNF